MTTYKALDIATILHSGQVDKAGHPYIDHPRGVAESLSRQKGWGDFTPAEMTVAYDAALLHDTIEDTSMTALGLAYLGVSPETIAVVRLLTYDGRESRDDYYERIKTNHIAKFVKMADVFHNLSRLNHLDSVTQIRLTKKYSHALEVLNG